MKIPWKKLNPVLGIAGLIFILLGYFPLTAFVDAQLLKLKDGLITQLETLIARKISYDSISPAIFNGIEIRGLVLEGGNSKSRIELSKIVLSYDIFDFFLRGESLLSEIRIVSSDIQLDTQRDKDILELIEVLVKQKDGIPPITVIGEDLALSISDKGNSYSVENIFFRFENLGESYTFSLDAEVNGEFTEDFFSIEDFQSTLSVRGRFDKPFRDALVELRIDTLKTNLFSVNAQSVRIGVLGDIVTVRNIQNSQPMDLLFSLDQRDDSWRLDFMGESISPSDIITINQNAELLTPWLYSSFSGNGFIQQNSQDTFFSFDGKISVDPRLFGDRLNVSTSFHGDDKIFIFDTLNIQKSGLNISYQGDVEFLHRSLSGKLEISEWTLPNSEVIKGRLYFSKTTEGLTAGRAEYFSVGNRQAESLTIQGDFSSENGYLNINLDMLDSLFANDGIQVQFTANWIRDYFQGFKSNLVFSELPLSLIVDQFEKVPSTFVDFSDPWRVSGNIGILWSNNFPQINIDSLAFNDIQANSRRLQVIGSFNPWSLKLKQATLDWDDVTMNITADAQRIRNEWTIKMSIDSGEISYQADIAFQVNSRSFILNGNYGTRLSFKENNNITTIDWSAENLPVPFYGSPILLSTQGTFFSSQNEWSVTDGFIKITKESWGSIQSLEFQTKINSYGSLIYLTQTSYSDSLSELKGYGMVPVTQNGLWSASLLLSNNQSESLGLLFEQSVTENRLNLQINRMPLERLGLTDIKGRFSTNTLFLQKDEVWSGEVYIDISEGRMGQDAFSLQGLARFEDQNILIETGKIDYLQQSLSNIRGQLNLKEGVAKLGAVFQGTVQGAPLNFDVNSDISLGEQIRFSGNDFSVDRITGRVALTKITYNKESQNDFVMTLSKIRSVTTIRGGEGNSFLGRITDDGNFRFQLNSPSPVQFRFDGRLDNGNLSSNITGIQFDAQALSFFIGEGIAKIRRGEIIGDISINGPISNPNILGTLLVNQISGKSTLVGGDFGPINTQLIFSEQGLEIAETRFRIGSGSVSLRGVFLLDRWIPERYIFSVDVKVGEEITLTYNVNPLQMIGNIAGTFEIQGNSFGANIKGNLILSETLINIVPVAPEPATVSNFNINTDLVITSGNRVEFVWPFANYPIIRAYIAPKQQIIFQSEGFTGNYKLIGSLNIRGGEIFYLNQIFFLREGEMRFNENQNKFDPFLTLRAELRRREPEGAVIIVLLVQDFLSKFSPRFESIPPKSPEEIALYIGNTILSPDQYTRIGFEGAINFATDIGSSFVLRPFEQLVKDTFQLDLFTVRTQILQRFVTGGLDNKAATLEDYLDNTSLFLGKYLGEDLFVEGLLSLNADKDINSLTYGEISGEVELGLELQTPFFLLNWKLVPQTPSQLFIPDNTLSFSWRWTY